MSTWESISQVNKVHCNISYQRAKGKANISKLTKARAYSNLQRYFTKKESKLIFKDCLKHVKIIEQSLNPHELTKTIQYLFESIDTTLKNIDKNKSSIFVSFHYGFFEIIPLFLSLYFQKSITIIVDSISISSQERIMLYKHLISSLKTEAEVNFVTVQDSLSLKKVIKKLRNNEFIFIYMDENKSLVGDKKSLVEVPFLGNHKYFLRKGLFTLIKHTNSPVYCIYSSLKNRQVELKAEDISRASNINSFYLQIIQILTNLLRKDSSQWTRWYCLDQLDEICLGRTSSEEIYLKIKIKFVNYLIDINNMKIKKLG